MKGKTIAKTMAVAMCAATLTLCAAFAAGCSEKEPEEDTKEPVTYPQYLNTVETTEVYTKTALYVMNEETDRRIYCIETVPNDVAEGEKLPLIIYVHGSNGSSTSLVGKQGDTYFTSRGIASINFECCGGNNIKPMSDGEEIYSSHYTSRISDLEAVIAHAKTLDWVDKDNIYIYGQSYGGLVCMFDAPRHNEDIAGMFLESTGITEDGSNLTMSGNGVVEKYLPPEDYEGYINSFTKDIMMFCSEGDELGADENSAYTYSIYEKRMEGNTRYYLFEGGKHAFSTYEQEAKDKILELMAAFIENGGIPESELAGGEQSTQQGGDQAQTPAE